MEIQTSRPSRLPTDLKGDLIWDVSNQFLGIQQPRTVKENVGANGVERWTLFDAANGTLLGKVPLPSTAPAFDEELRGNSPTQSQCSSIFRYGGSSRVDAFAVHPFGRRIACRDSFGGLWCWGGSGLNGYSSRNLPFRASITKSASNKHAIAIASGNAITVFRYEDNRLGPKRVLKRMHRDPVTHIALSDDGELLTSIDESGGGVIWDLLATSPISKFSLSSATGSHNSPITTRLW